MEGPSVSACAWVAHAFLSPNDVPLSGCTTVCLSVSSSEMGRMTLLEEGEETILSSAIKFLSFASLLYRLVPK